MWPPGTLPGMETPAKSAPQLQQDAVAAARQGRYWDAMLLWARAFEVALTDEPRAWLLGREPRQPTMGRDGRALAGLPPMSEQTAPGSNRPWLLEWASFVLIGDPVVRFARESG